jgi:3-methyladenine DNA glycosylase AlkC
MIESLSLEGMLDRVRPFANDEHFGVREWAWLAVRPAIAQDIERSIALLLPWAADSSANIRRFAIEVTRPRGVWSKHISALKGDGRSLALCARFLCQLAK